MIIGAILQTASYGYAQMVVARIVTGLGNGLNVRPQIQEDTISAVTLAMLSRATDFDCPDIPCGMFSRHKPRQSHYDRRKSHHVWYYDIVSIRWYQIMTIEPDPCHSYVSAAKAANLKDD